MPTQEAKAHHVGEWASLRNTSPEIAEAIFEVAGYDEKMAEKIWEEGSDEVLVKAFAKTDKDSLFGANRPSNVKTFNQRLPRFSRGVFCYFTASFNTLSNLSIGQKPLASIGQPLNSSVTRCAGACRVNASALRNCSALWYTYSIFIKSRLALLSCQRWKTILPPIGVRSFWSCN